VEKDQIRLIGIDANSLVAEKAEIVASSTHIFCADRFLDLLHTIVAGVPGVQISNISPLYKALEKIAEIADSSKIAVLAGGDPLFFGIGRTLCKRFGRDSIQIYPAVSSMQKAFARFRIPWDDALFLSVHGRDPKGLAAKIGSRTKVFLLTDGKNSPDRIAANLLSSMGEKEAADCRIYVAEKLDLPDEHLTRGTPQEISGGIFSDLSVMIIIIPKKKRDCRFGLKEQEITHSRGLITKSEVRAATLHALRLPDSGVFWDIGAGSGSISIEAAGMLPNLEIYAVESKAEQMANILVNKAKFSTFALTPIHGIAPEALERLPNPDRVFIGGSGGNLKEILNCCAGRLKPNGIVVINGVLEKTRLQTPEILHRLGFEVAISTVMVSRSTYPEEHPVALNPIAIITGTRKKAILKGM